MRFSGYRLVGTAFVFAIGCASTPVEPREPEATTELAPEPLEPPVGEESASPEAEGTASTDSAPPPDAGAESTPASNDAGPAAEPFEPPEREVRYVVNPEGMRVRTEGVVLRPRAEAVRAGKGHAVRVTVRLRLETDMERSVLAPEGQELAFAGRVLRADGTQETFSDTRSGDRGKTLAPGGELVLSRTWPDAKDVKPLGPGDELELAVGIWGLGESPDERRPLRALCKVTAKGRKGGAPQVTVAPPETATKESKRRVREE